MDHESPTSMPNHAGHTPSRSRPLWIATCVVLAIAALLLWRDHRAHVLGVLPYLLILSCPIMHLLMHRRHRHHEDSR